MCAFVVFSLELLIYGIVVNPVVAKLVATLLLLHNIQGLDLVCYVWLCYSWFCVFNCTTLSSMASCYSVVYVHVVGLVAACQLWK